MLTLLSSNGTPIKKFDANSKENIIQAPQAKIYLPESNIAKPFSPENPSAVNRLGLQEWLRTAHGNFKKTASIVGQAITDGVLSVQRIAGKNGQNDFVIRHGDNQPVTIEVPNNERSSTTVKKAFNLIESGNNRTSAGYESLEFRAADILGNKVYNSNENLDSRTGNARLAAKIALARDTESMTMQIKPLNSINKFVKTKGQKAAHDITERGNETSYEKAAKLIYSTILKADSQFTGGEISRFNMNKSRTAIKLKDGVTLFVGHKTLPEEGKRPILGVMTETAGKKEIMFVSTGYGGVFDRLRKDAVEMMEKINKAKPNLKIVK
jgi:hypothetical protein